MPLDPNNTSKPSRLRNNAREHKNRSMRQDLVIVSATASGPNLSVGQWAKGSGFQVRDYGLDRMQQLPDRTFQLSERIGQRWPNIELPDLFLIGP